MSFFKKKAWVIFVLIIAVTIVLAYISRSGNNPVANAVNSCLTPVQSKMTEWVIDPVKGFFDSIANSKKYKKENKELKIKNTELEAKVKEISEYINENERLMKLLNLNETMENYKTVTARVVGVEPDNWFSYITINKGANSGIKISDTVITAEGLLGQVSAVGNNWAKISTIINNESSAGVRIIRNGEIGIIEGDLKLIKTKKCRLQYLVSNASVISGDILETSGLGGIYPPEIKVGKITDIRKDNMGQLDYAIVEPFVNFSDLHEVIVITDWSMNHDIYDDETKADVPEPSYDDNSNNEGEISHTEEIEPGQIVG